MSGSTKGSSAATRGGSAGSASPSSGSHAATSKKTAACSALTSELKRALSAVLPATSGDDFNVVLSGVHLSATGGMLTLHATDRYVAARAIVRVNGDLAPTFLTASDAKLLIAHLRGTPKHDTVKLRRTKRTLVITMPETTVVFTVQDINNWPADQLDDIFSGKPSKPAEKTEATPGNFALSPKLLSALSRVLAVLPRETDTRWRVQHHLLPILVDAEEWLTVAVMPMRQHSTNYW